MTNNNVTFIQGGITSVPGITAAGIFCGIKKKEAKDLALVRSVPPATAAGAFTTNVVVSPSVALCREHLERSDRIEAILVNSGNANACTGEKGLGDAREITRLAALSLGFSPESILIASTGVIGVPLPMDAIRKGIPVLVESLAPTGGNAAAQAIMTTDLVSKECAVEYEWGGRKITIGGMAKGSGMIHPNMATMLAFIATDLSIAKNILGKVLKEAVDLSFNRITVDGETSTNDAVLCLANGLAKNPEITGEGEDLDAFRGALTAVCLELAASIVRDGEGATKFIEIEVAGAQTDEGAEGIARRVANSLLVKTAFFGQDPNWGRILAAAGAAGVAFNPSECDLAFGGVAVMRGGSPVAGVDASRLKEIMARREIGVRLKVGNGPGRAVVYTTDLSYDYVKINAEYTS